MNWEAMGKGLCMPIASPVREATGEPMFAPTPLNGTYGRRHIMPLRWYTSDAEQVVNLI